MPGYLGEPRSFGLKVVSVMPGNHGTGYDSHQGVVMLFGLEHGEPLAILDATAITAIRTAAASGLATQVLARENAGDLALIGSGAQASTHLQAMACVRTLRRVRVFSRSQANAERFAREARGREPRTDRGRLQRRGRRPRRGPGLHDDRRRASRCCSVAGSSPGPTSMRWGRAFPRSRELDTDAVRRSRLYTDRRESCENESGDYRLALAEGAITPAHLLGELGDVLTGKVRAGSARRRDALRIARHRARGPGLRALHPCRAKATGAGTWLEWGGPADGH
jgi:ornithine cyclodeaminase